MIEGLKVLVNAQELKLLCVARAAYHAARAKHYESQIESLRALDVAGTSIQPGREAQTKIESHNSQAAEMAFIAEHLVASESYQLDSQDLYKLGINHRSY